MIAPDGPRYILKQPEKAFAITFPEWDARVEALVKFFTGDEAKVDAKIYKKTKSIVKNLTENYAALQAHYQAAYLGWCGNPCSKEAEKAYNDAKALICKKEFTLRELESDTLKIADKIRTGTKQPKTKKKMGGAKDNTPDLFSAQMPFPEEKIPIPEAFIDNIQELVSKLKV